MNSTKHQAIADKLLDVLREVVAHEIDIVTDSDWFEQYIAEKIEEAVKREVQS